MKNYKTKSLEEKKKEISELSNKLKEGITDYLNGDKYKELLNNMAKFHNYSFSNSVLIGLQLPEATQVGSAAMWNKFNRLINKGEHGLQIFVPMKLKKEEELKKLDKNGDVVLDKNGKEIIEKKEIESLHFKIGYVFDVSQTHQIEGKKEYILSPCKELVENFSGYEELMDAIKKASSVPIEIKKINTNAKGYYSDAEKKIVIKDGLSESHTIKTAFHEMAHSLLHGKNTVKSTITFDVAECEEFPNYGEFYDNLTLEEAVKIYERIPSDRLRAGKCIGFELHNGDVYSDYMVPLVKGDKIQIETINFIDEFKNNFEVQKAIMDARQYFSDDGFSLQSLKEVQAESIAYVVAQYYGLDTSDYSFGYVGTWMNDRKDLRDNLETIKVTSKEIIDRIDESLKMNIQDKFNIHSVEEMAKNLDSFMKDLDPFDYQDQEIYVGSNFDKTLSMVRKGQVNDIYSTLKEVIKDNRDERMTTRAKNLVKVLSTMEKTQDIVQTISRGKGLKR